MKKFAVMFCILFGFFVFSCSDDSGNSDNGNSQTETVSVSATASEAATKISSRKSSIKITVTGTMTKDILNAIATAIGGFSDKKVSLDLSGTTGLTVIPDGSFRSSGDLIEIVLPEGITTIGDNNNGMNAKSVFGYGLQSITIPSSVTKIGACAFWGCGNNFKSAVFKNPSGWKTTSTSVYTGTTTKTISSSELSDPLTAAQKLMISLTEPWSRS